MMAIGTHQDGTDFNFKPFKSFLISNQEDSRCLDPNPEEMISSPHSNAFLDLDGDCNPDIFPQQEKNQDNPHKNTNIEKNDKELGYTNYNAYNSSDDNNVGISKAFDEQWYLDIIGTSHCRSRTIACTQAEFQTFQMFKKKKAQLISAHATWIDTITAQKKAMAMGLKAYRYLTEGVELMNELGVDCDEADLIKTNSSGLTIYNPVNLASMLKGMKNKTMTREQKIAERMKYDTVVVATDTSSLAH